MTLTAVMLAALAWSAAAAASQGAQAPAPPPKAPSTSPSPAPKAPYANLFRQRSLVEAALAQQRAAMAGKAAPEVRCGILVIPADPTIDPKIRVGPPPSTTEHTMRLLEPPCPGSAPR
jgi:hypothetical protein